MTRALLVVHRGAIVAERYGPGFHSQFDEAEGRERVADGPDTRLTSWSMAKSMLQMAIGIAIRGHDLRVDRGPGARVGRPRRPRHQITWHHLLHMTSGLSWIEEYTTDRGSDVINMLFGAGKQGITAFAAAFPLSSRPGSQFLYSSGTSNILARALQHELGLEGDEAGVRAWLQAELFDPIGIRDSEPHFDDAGTWVASSYVDATARDFAARAARPCAAGPGTAAPSSNRAGSTRRARRSASPPPPAGYGSHWWTHDDGLGTFAAHGYEGQRITCVPERDLIVVRLGKTPPTPSDRDRDVPPVDTFVEKIIGCFSA